MVSFPKGRQESKHDLEYLDPKYWEDYTDDVDPVHYSKGTCNLSGLVGVKVMCEVTYQTWVVTNYLPLVKLCGVHVKLPCITLV